MATRRAAIGTLYGSRQTRRVVAQHDFKRVGTICRDRDVVVKRVRRSVSGRTYVEVRRRLDANRVTAGPYAVDHHRSTGAALWRNEDFTFVGWIRWYKLNTYRRKMLRVSVGARVDTYLNRDRRHGSEGQTHILNVGANVHGRFCCQGLQPRLRGCTNDVRAGGNVVEGKHTGFHVELRRQPDIVACGCQHLEPDSLIGGVASYRSRDPVHGDGR